MDFRLQELARRYAAYRDTDTAHALAAAYIRSTSLSEKNSEILAIGINWNLNFFIQACIPPEMLLIDGEIAVYDPQIEGLITNYLTEFNPHIHGPYSPMGYSGTLLQRIYLIRNNREMCELHESEFASCGALHQGSCPEIFHSWNINDTYCNSCLNHENISWDEFDNHPPLIRGCLCCDLIHNNIMAEIESNYEYDD